MHRGGHFKEFPSPWRVLPRIGQFGLDPSPFAGINILPPACALVHFAWYTLAVRKRRPVARKGRQGVGLAILLVLCSIIILLTLTAAGNIETMMARAYRGLDSNEARYIARSGLARGLQELSVDPNWDPGTLILPDGDPNSIPFHDPRLGCELLVINNRLGGGPVPTPEGTMVPAGKVWMQSTGLVNGEKLTKVGGIASYEAVQPEVSFDIAVHSRSAPLSLPQPGIVIGSYTSSSDYGDVKPLVGFRDNAVVRSPDGVFVGGGSIINGLAEIPRSSVLTSGTITRGFAVVPGGPLPLKFAEPRRFLLAGHPNAGGGSLTPGPYNTVTVPNGGSLDLSGGVYFIDRLMIGDNAIVRTVGASSSSPAVVYLGHSFNVGDGAQVNWDARPRLLQFYTTDRDLAGRDTFTIGNNAQCSFTIASRELALKLGTAAQLYGAIDAQSVDFNGPNARVIFDENLLGNNFQGESEWILLDER